MSAGIGVMRCGRLSVRPVVGVGGRRGGFRRRAWPARRRDLAAHAGVQQRLGQRFLGMRVGEEAVDLGNVGQLDHGLALELAAVGGQPDFARLFDDGAGDAHFAEVVVAQRAVGLDAGNADQADIHLELADEIHGGFANDASVARADHAAGHDHLAVRIVGQDVGHVQVVGDDAQATMAQQARAMASVVVPMFRISEQPSGTARATASAMRCLPAACSPWRLR